jgi:hypothetical protein
MNPEVIAKMAVELYHYNESIEASITTAIRIYLEAIKQIREHYVVEDHGG